MCWLKPCELLTEFVCKNRVSAKHKPKSARSTCAARSGPTLSLSLLAHMVGILLRRRARLPIRLLSLAHHEQRNRVAVPWRSRGRVSGRVWERSSSSVGLLLPVESLYVPTKQNVYQYRNVGCFRETTVCKLRCFPVELLSPTWLRCQGTCHPIGSIEPCMQVVSRGR